MEKTNSTERPEWVPEWIWEIYLGIKSKKGFPAFTGITLDTLMADRRCAVVWNALTNRKGTEFKVFREAHGWAHADVPAWEDVEMLLYRIPVMASGLLEEDKVPSAERGRQGTKIARIALDLRNALDEARFADRWPHPLASALAQQVLEVAKAHGDEKLRGWEKAVFYDPDAALDDLCEELTALTKAAESWSSWISMVPRPNDPNAARLRFIRHMTEFFHRMYDSPLREPVAALTSVLFQCDMDAATVAKLAPLNEKSRLA